jgi:hypothetical protein
MLSDIARKAFDSGICVLASPTGYLSGFPPARSVPAGSRPFALQN